MLGMNSYPRTYIDACRARTLAQIARYRARPGPDAAFEAEFCNTMVLALEMMFVHRLRGLELKDGNPANEVRMLANALLVNDGKMTALSPIKYDPAKTVLGLKLDDPIAIGIDGLQRLATAYFDDITRKYAA